jgi:hypothetical protein
MNPETISAWMRSFYKLSLSAAVFFVLSTSFTASTSGQETSQSITVGNAKITGVPEDWTHHHAVFSDPGTEVDALKNGTYSEWSSIVNDPRYIFQQLKRRLPAQGPAADDVARIEEEARTRDAAQTEETAGEATAPKFGGIKGWSRPKLTNDWSMILGPSATVGAGNYPAKFSFFPNATPNCGNTSTPDFVVYNTSVLGTTSQASIVAYDNLYSSCPATLQGIPSVYWAFNTSGTVKTSPVLSLTGSQVIFVQTPMSGSAQLVLLSWAATPAGRSVTGKVTSGSKNFTVSAGTLTSMDVGAVMTGTGIPAGDTIATVTGTGITGTLVANATITTGASGEALAISADAGGPAAPTLVSAGSYSGCAIPCMTTLTFAGSGTRADNFSSPYYDYSHDTLYVGDASGGLHKFQPVLNGTPTEIGTPWAALGSTAVTSPVYDETTGDVYAGDASGFLYSVNAAGTVVKSVQVANSPGIVDSPLVDLSAGQIYAFVPQDFNSTNSSTSPCASLNSGNKTICNGVVQLPATFTATTDFTESVFGVGTTNTLYIGTFDNNYETSGTGNIYATGATGANDPKLMETPVNASGFNGVACQSGTGLPTGGSALQCSTSIVTLTTAAAAGAPVIEVLNGTTDRIFTGVAASSATAAACTTGNGCISSWTSTTTIAANTNAGAGMILLGGPSGIIIDNTSSLGGTSQVYCGTLGTTGTCTTSGTLTTGGCAVQSAQNGL